MQYSAWAPDANQISYQANRYVYFKQNNTLIKKCANTTILVNPNFKPSIHVNPNFTASGGATRGKTAVYINPNVFKDSRLHIASNNNIEAKTITPETTVKWKTDKELASINKALINRVTPSTGNTTVPSKPLIVTRTKIVRAPVNMESVMQVGSVEKSRYKFVKKKENLTVQPLHRSSNLCSKFKIDNRGTNGSKSNRKVTRKSKGFIYVSPVKNSTSYIKIGGLLYKNSRMKLQRSNSFEGKHKESRNPVTPKRKIHKIINKSGIRYEVNINRRALKRMSASSPKMMKQPLLNPQKIKRLRAVLFAERNFIKSRCVIKKSKQIMHPSPSKLKKCNVPCVFYRKFGRCRGKDRGVCNKIHDPAHVIICPRFLQGACVNKTCLLSHNVSPEKMPTCKFFLEGMCSKEDCPYLHVKINPKAEVCQDFLKGYCKKGKECEKRHQYLCPDFEKHGKCAKKRCPYPHGNMVRGAVSKKRKLSVKQQATKVDKVNSEFSTKNMHASSNDHKRSESGSSCNARYYKEVGNTELLKDSKNTKTVSEIELKRSKLGDLPCFIPLAGFSGNV